MKAHRSRISAITLLALGALCGVIVVETSLKVIAATPLWRVLPVIEPILGRPDRETGYSFTPQASGIWVKENRAPIVITDLGLRGPDGIAAQKPPNIVRIGVTGDSVVEALQVEYDSSFTALLQGRLNGQRLTGANRRVEVLNLAQAGQGPLRQLLRLETVGYALDLDVVVSIAAITDFLSGELLDDSLNPAYVADGLGGLTRGYAYQSRFAIRHLSSPAAQVFLTAIQHSEVARLVYLRSRERPLKLLGLEAKDRQPAAPAMQPEPCEHTTLSSLHRLWRERQPERHWKATQKFFDEYAAGMRAHRVKAIYVLRDIPLPPPECEAERAMRADLVAAIAAVLDSYDIAAVDLEARLANLAGVRDSSGIADIRGFGIDRGRGHLNYEGHKTYADALIDLLGGIIRKTP